MAGDIDDSLVIYEVGEREHELRMKGLSWTEITSALGYGNPDEALVLHTRFMQRAALLMSDERKVEALALEVGRLDALQTTYWADAMAGDIKSAELCLKIIGQRAKLMRLGEDDTVAAAPRTILVTGNTEQYVTSLKAIIAGETDAPPIDLA